MLLAGAISGLHAIESRVQQRLAELDRAGWQHSTVPGSPIVAVRGVAVASVRTLEPLVAALRRSRFVGSIEAELATDLEIPLKPGESEIRTRQEFVIEAGEVTRLVQVPEDRERDVILFLVDRKEYTLHYVATSAGILRKAVRDDGKRLEVLGPAEAASGFEQERRFWEAKFGLRRDTGEVPAPIE